MAVFNPKDHPPAIPGLAHGSMSTLNTVRYRTPIKIEFNVSSTQTAFNLPKEHCAILQLLVAKDPTMEIVPKNGQPHITDLLQFPANEEAYNLLFDHAIQKQPADAKKMILAHNLITNTKFSDLKFQNPALMDYMYKHKVWLKFNQSENLEVAALGFIQDVHPRIAYRDDYRFHLEEAVQREMTPTERETIKGLLPASKKRDNTGDELNPEIKLEVIARHLGYGNGDDRIKTDAFEIRVPIEIRIEIKEILTRLGSKGTIPEGRFIPYGLAQTVGADVHKQMIRMQNDFLKNFRVIPVFGLLPSALAHKIMVTTEDKKQIIQTVEEFITSQPSINGIELTNRTADLGKIFFKSDAANILQARDFVDRVLKGLYESPDSIPASMILPNFNPPRRGDAPRAASTAFSSYATALANLGNPQEEHDTTDNNAPPPRPNRRNLNVMYDLAGDFPNLPRRNNQTQVAPQQTSNPQTETQTSGLTQDSLAKFRDDLKREFTDMIKNEVKNQIQQEMAAMQASLNLLSGKFDTMQGTVQETIRDSIGHAIRESMQGARQQYPPPAQYQPTQPPTQQHAQQTTQPNQHYTHQPTTQPQQQQPATFASSNSQDAEMHDDQGPHSQQQTMGAQNQ